MLDGRRSQFTDEVASSEGVSRDEAAASVDRRRRPVGLVRWLGGQGGAGRRVVQPRCRPVFQLQRARAHRDRRHGRAPGLLIARARVSVLAPVLVTGNTVVLLASEQRPLPAITLAEVLATSDVPGGVVNLITGRVGELAPVLAAHRDVDALDLAGAPRISSPISSGPRSQT